MIRDFGQILHRWDTIAFQTIFGLNGKALFDRSIYWISKSGDGYIYGLIGILLLLLEPTHGRNFFMTALMAYALEIPLYTIIKRTIKRARPFNTIPGMKFLIAPPDEFSFPSGHTAAAFLMAILLSHFYPAVQVPALIWALLIGFSRIYLGVHYPTDVAVGAVLGYVVAKTSLWLAI